MITIKEKIKEAAREMIFKETLRLDRDRKREDLMGLYGDIVDELSRRAPGHEAMIYEYADLMKLEQNLYCPEKAYEAGAGAGDAQRDRAFMEYIMDIFLDPENRRFLQKRDSMYYEIRAMLGEAGGLLDEFNELYRACYGIIGNVIDRFFEMGYTSGGINESEAAAG